MGRALHPTRRRTHRFVVIAAAAMLCSAVLASVPAGAAAAPLSLALPSSTAFTILGHWCGGIQQQIQATHLRSTTVTGAVYLQTRCSSGGRGGPTVTYSAWASVVWNFSGAVTSDAVLSGAPSGLNPSFSATDARGDHLYNTLTAVNVSPTQCTIGNTTYCYYRAYLSVVAPGTPTGVAAGQTNDQFSVSWTPAPSTAALVTSSTITATPVGSSAPVLSATVSGPLHGGLVGPLMPSTTYSITVVSYDAGGASPPSAPVRVKTAPATTLPGAPSHLSAAWTAPGASGDSLLAKWTAPVSGNSPISSYQVDVAAHDADGAPPGPYSATVSGSTLSASFAIDDTFDWAVKVRAHNAAGWGPWSASVVLAASG